ncbi:unnamed protein product, partial [Polarella glacialis]
GFLGRLDAQSSGLVLCALSYEAHLLLQLRQDTHAVSREYVVLCHGHVPTELKEVNAPIRAEPGMSSRVDTATGMPAVTWLRPIAWLVRADTAEKYSLVVLSILTGRKHQIRTHLAHVGHPVVCDGRYGPQKLEADLSWCPRNFLHRFRLEWPELPLAGTEVSKSRHQVREHLPDDLRQVLRASGLRPWRAGCAISAEALDAWAEGAAPLANFDAWAEVSFD